GPTVVTRDLPQQTLRFLHYDRSGGLQPLQQSHCSETLNIAAILNSNIKLLLLPFPYEYSLS
ncbi:hypothetical protein HAX54_040713, partial [Datura stramonium]|nr:hypothetical protein [Datura stramonium]